MDRSHPEIDQLHGFGGKREAVLTLVLDLEPREELRASCKVRRARPRGSGISSS